MKWFFPSYYGDFRLEQAGEKKSTLVVEKATAAEKKILKEFLKKAFAKDWCAAAPDLELGELRVELTVDVATSGKLLLKYARPKKASLTAVKSVGGKVEVVEGSNETAITRLMAEDTKAAASVNRPTLCCPNCEVGEVNSLANEVLQTFLTEDQHATWAKDRMIFVRGNLTGHRYVLAHRNTAQAAKQGKICMDLDDRAVVHFHDQSVPPEEEVLASKLILEHREHWLRNEASTNGVPIRMRFKNPFGDMTDGVADSSAIAAFGSVLQGFV